MNQRFTYRNPKILSHARGQMCQNCFAQDDTVVAAHSNMSEHGHGRGIKAHDLFCAYLCQACHSWLDQGKGRDPTNVWSDDREDKQQMFTRAMHRTMLILVRDGVLK